MFPSRKADELTATHFLRLVLERVVQSIRPTPGVTLERIDVRDRGDSLTLNGLVRFGPAMARFEARFYKSGLVRQDRYVLGPEDLVLRALDNGHLFYERWKQMVVIERVNGPWQITRFENDPGFDNSLAGLIARREPHVHL